MSIWCLKKKWIYWLYQLKIIKKKKNYKVRNAPAERLKKKTSIVSRYQCIIKNFNVF